MSSTESQKKFELVVKHFTDNMEQGSAYTRHRMVAKISLADIPPGEREAEFNRIIADAKAYRYPYLFDVELAKCSDQLEPIVHVTFCDKPAGANLTSQEQNFPITADCTVPCCAGKATFFQRFRDKLHADPVTEFLFWGCLMAAGVALSLWGMIFVLEV